MRRVIFVPGGNFLLDEGYGKPARRRLPYNDLGVVLFRDVTTSLGQQTGEYRLVRRE